MKPLKILLLYPETPQTFWSLTHALEFFGKRAWSPPLGLLTVAAMLPRTFECRLRDLNVAPLDPADLAWADYAFISAMGVQRASAERLIARCRQAGVKTVAGGPLFTGDPDAFPEVDHLVLNEAELTLPCFLDDLARGQAKPRYSSPDFAELSSSPAPAYSLLDTRAYGAMGVQFSRGCPYQCEFCDVTALFGRRPRIKTAAQIVAELEVIYSRGWRGKIYFVDDNLMCNKPYLKHELLPAIIAWRTGKPSISFHTQITINLADDPELMDLLYEAGFDWIFVGIETPSVESLSECGKRQNLNRDLPAQVRRLQLAGLQVQGGFIVGFDHDPPDIFERQFRLIQDNGIVMAMVGVLQAPPGTELYARLQREGRILKNVSGDNVVDEANFVTRMDRDVLRSNFRALVHDLYEPCNYYNRVRRFLQFYKEPRQKPPLNKAVIVAVLRCLVRLGGLDSGRSHFWRILLWTCWHKPQSIQNFIGLAILGHHFRQVYQQVSLPVRPELAQCPTPAEPVGSAQNV